MQVMLQQGCQLKDMFGGVGPAARALGGYVAGMVNPFTIAAAAAYTQIKALDDQGRSSDAAALAIKTYADAVDERSKQVGQSVGGLERTWKGLAGAAKSAWDAMLDIGRDGSLADKIAAAEKSIAASRERVGAMQAGGIDSPYLRFRQRLLADDEAALKLLKEKGAAEDAAAVAKGKTNKQDQAGIEWAKDGDKFLTRRQQMEKDIAQQRQIGINAGRSEEEIQKRLAGIREKYTEKKAPKDEMVDGREQAKSYVQQYEAADKLARGMEAEAAAGEKLLPVARALAEARATLSAAQAGELEKRLAGAAVIERRTQAEKDAAAASKIYADALQHEIGPIDARARQLATERENAGKSEAQITARTLAIFQEARATAAANGALQEHLDSYDRQIASIKGVEAEIDLAAQAHADWLAGAKAGTTEYVRTTMDAAGQAKRAWSGTWKRAKDDLTQFFVSGKLNVRGFVAYAINEFARINLAQPLVKSAVSAGGGFLDKLLGFGESSNYAEGFGPMAKGAVVDSSADLHRYANTVVSSPTRFRFAKGGAFGGLFGEAGPEAVMPLKRGKDGSLGVAVQGGSAGGAIMLTYAPVFEIDARGAGVGVGPMLQGVVDAAVNRSKSELMTDLANGGQFAYATGRRRS